ncbi:MAG: alpha/beta hydrolase [Planctomycetales bacterium]|nr:alpha/beta hydrolase [Planctomycetales bacterium]
MDLHMPREAWGSKLLVWVHGGAWRSGSKDDPPLKGLSDSGYTVASVDYRLSPAAEFPAQVHDIKAAIRFLRAISPRYGYRTEKIAIAGASAGGHLAALVGVSNRHPELEGTIGEHPEQSSAVQAVVDFYGPTNLNTILAQSTPHGLGVRVPALQLLLGGQPVEKTELARLASPVEHVGEGDPPLLMIHGDQDPQVPVNQSLELQGRYEALELPVLMHVVHGGGHGGEEFYNAAMLDRVRRFLDRLLDPPAHGRSDGE